MRWAVGVTTVPRRRDDLLPRTLASLALGGFERVRLFVDGAGHEEARSYEQQFGLDVTARNPVIRTFANWTLALAELYMRDPRTDLFLLAQDDFVTYRNLRQYLERVPYPDKGYLNLYTFPSNQSICPGGRVGFYLSNQFGRGAVALVFSRDAVLTLLTHSHMVNRPMNVHRGHKSVDGGVVTALRLAGWSEYVHNPSLVQHTGLISSMGNRQHPQAISFRGEDFDALELLR